MQLNNPTTTNKLRFKEESLLLECDAHALEE